MLENVAFCAALVEAEEATYPPGLTLRELSEAVMDRTDAIYADRSRSERERRGSAGARSAQRRPTTPRNRARRRRETRSSSSRGSPSSDDDHEPEPALGRTPGETLARLRVDRGFSQRRAAMLAGITQAAWSRIESDLVTSPRPRTRAEAARVVGVRPSDIWRAAK